TASVLYPLLPKCQYLGGNRGQTGGVNPKIETRKLGTHWVKWKGVPNVGKACIQLGVQGAGSAAHAQRRERQCAESRITDQAQRAVPLARRLSQGGSGGLAAGQGPAAGGAESAA